MYIQNRQLLRLNNKVDEFATPTHSQPNALSNLPKKPKETVMLPCPIGAPCDGPILQWIKFNGEEVRLGLIKTRAALKEGKISNRVPSQQMVYVHANNMSNNRFIWYAQSTPVLLNAEGLVVGGWNRWNAADLYCDGDKNKTVIFPVYYVATSDQIRFQDCGMRHRTANHSAMILCHNVNLGAFRPFTKATVGSTLRHLWMFKNEWNTITTAVTADGAQTVEAYEEFSGSMQLLSEWISDIVKEVKLGGEVPTSIWTSAPMLIPLVHAVPYVDPDTYKQFLRAVIGKEYVARHSPVGVMRHWYEDWKIGKDAHKYGGNPVGWKVPFLQVLRCLYAYTQGVETMFEDRSSTFKVSLPNRVWSDSTVEEAFNLK